MAGEFPKELNDPTDAANAFEALSRGRVDEATTTGAQLTMLAIMRAVSPSGEPAINARITQGMHPLTETNRQHHIFL